MTKNELTELVNQGREIEFTFKSKKYSITYYNDDREKYISFCEFYQEILDVATVNELWHSTYKGIKVQEIIRNLKDEDCVIF